MDITDLGALRSHLPFAVIFSRMICSMICGALIGIERERKNLAAGLRTHMLVCLSACLVAILTQEIVHHPDFRADGVQMDPLRLIEAVTAGVAFLVGGLIVFSRGRVRGMTTGAGLWFSGSIGLSCGLGFALIAVTATALAIFVLLLLNWLEPAFTRKGRRPVSEESSARRRSREGSP